MRSPAAALLWQIIRAQRLGLGIGVFYLSIATIVAHLLATFFTDSSLGDAVLPSAGRYLAMPCFLMLVHLLATFSVAGSADFQENGYSPFMLVLPVSTRALAFWPMFGGSLAVAATWLVIAVGILRPTGTAAPLLWPIVALMVLLTALQAVNWCPFSQSWLRFVVAVPTLTLPILAIICIEGFKISPTIALAGFLTVLPLMVVACYQSLVLARCGDQIEWRFAAQLADRFSDWRKPIEHPFSSPDQAQRWYELRVFGRLLPMCIALVTPLFGLLLFVYHANEVAAVWRVFIALLFTPAFLAMILSGQAGNMAFPFQAIRPISTSQFVLAKVQAALICAIVSSAVTFLALPFFFIRPSFLNSIQQLLGALGPLRSVEVIVAAIVVPPLLTWKFTLENLWLGLSGRPWVANVYTAGFAILFGVGVLLGIWIELRPDWHANLKTISPYFIYLALFFKLILAVYVMRELIKRHLATNRTVLILVCSWLALTVLFSVLICTQVRGLELGPATICALIAISLPINRIAAAPLMLEWNRHR